MTKQVIPDSLVFTVHSWFQSAMKRVGRNIKFPKCNDLTKTYQFRWTKIFVDRCYNELNIDDKTMKVLVYDLVDYAKKENLLTKGTQILSLSNIVDVCYYSIKHMMNDEDSLIRELRSCHRFLYDQVGGKDSPVPILKDCGHSGLPNIVYWYNTGRITSTYLALSLPCIRALNDIAEDQKADLPSSFELFRMCTHILMDNSLITKIRSEMGKDLRIPETIGK